jgi:hypothetical protein
VLRRKRTGKLKVAPSQQCLQSLGHCVIQCVVFSKTKCKVSSPSESPRRETQRGRGERICLRPATAEEYQRAVEEILVILGRFSKSQTNKSRAKVNPPVSKRVFNSSFSAPACRRFAQGGSNPRLSAAEKNERNYGGLPEVFLQSN